MSVAEENKYLSGELIVHELKTCRDITDEYVTSVNLEFPMIRPVEFELMGADYVVQKIVVRSKWLEDGLELLYVINGCGVELLVPEQHF